MADPKFDVELDEELQDEASEEEVEVYSEDEKAKAPDAPAPRQNDPVPAGPLGPTQGGEYRKIPGGWSR